MITGNRESVRCHYVGYLHKMQSFPHTYMNHRCTFLIIPVCNLECSISHICWRGTLNDADMGLVGVASCLFEH